MSSAQAYRTTADRYGLTQYPNGVEQYYADFVPTYTAAPLLRRGFLSEICARYDVCAEHRQRMIVALDEMEQDEALLRLTHFFVSDLRAISGRLALDEYDAMEPTQGMREPQWYAMLLLLACMEPSIQERRGRGMPDALFLDTAFNAAARQMQKLRNTGDPRVSDFPWDRSFYTCDIFRIGRFYFKAERMEYPIAVYRNGLETIAFFSEPKRVRRDGQLDGVNGQFDPKAYETVYIEEEGRITGNPIHPAGVVEPRVITLDTSAWKLVLRQDDIKLGLHIPDGPGYDPAHLRSDTAEAYSFFRRWFPETEILAFGNESWLNDPHLALLVKPGANIPAMQREMYQYPCDTGEKMLIEELYHGQPIPCPGEQGSSLQHAMAAYMRQGGRATSTCTFLLPQDIERIGDGPYATPATYAREWEKLRTPTGFEAKGTAVST